MPIMVLFGAPIAHEGTMRNGRCARRWRCSRRWRRLIAAQGTTLGLYCGVNTGPVIAGGGWGPIPCRIIQSSAMRSIWRRGWKMRPTGANLRRARNVSPDRHALPLRAISADGAQRQGRPGAGLPRAGAAPLPGAASTRRWSVVSRPWWASESRTGPAARAVP